MLKHLLLGLLAAAILTAAIPETDFVVPEITGVLLETHMSSRSSMSYDPSSSYDIKVLKSPLPATNPLMKPEIHNPWSLPGISRAGIEYHDFDKKPIAMPKTLKQGPTWCPWSVCNVITPAPGKSIGLRGGKDKRYCGLRGDGHQITCDGNPQETTLTGRKWAAGEKFTIVDAGDGKIAIKSARDGKYCADEGNTIKCNRDAIGGWEKFTIVDAGDGKIAIKSDRDGKYCADDGNTIKCNRDAIGGWEKFTSFGLRQFQFQGWTGWRRRKLTSWW